MTLEHHDPRLYRDCLVRLHAVGVECCVATWPAPVVLLCADATVWTSARCISNLRTDAICGNGCERGIQWTWHGLPVLINLVTMSLRRGQAGRLTAS